ncbi:DUF3344 domain-containing protein [Methanofollis ethanolicus]|uniref:DUF3344 domain-containing protein n=1 Tax=Methanofollis ethanolicus TaxID=488124 RepID=UPI001365E711|nr:DUF3344 domain-containing protein [Methanofollis ethanolicus]
MLLAAVCIAPAVADDVGGITMPGTSNFDLILSDGMTKFFKFEGGGLNALHVTTDPESEPYGQVTTTEEQSGVFYLSETGGRGFFDDMILMVAVNGAVPDDFALHIRASGYRWTPTPALNMPPTADQIEYVDGAYEGTITKENFKYSPQTWKPAGNNLPGAYPIYYGQDVSDGSNPFHTVYIDLNVGNIGKNSQIDGLKDMGAVKIEYEFENFGTFAAFNSYGWCNQSNQGQGISWTNRIVGEGSSGYAVIGTAPQGGDVAPGSGEGSDTGASSGLSGSEFTKQESGEVNGHVALVTTNSAPALLDGGGSATLSLVPPAGTETVKKATLYLFVDGSKQDDIGIDPALRFTLNGRSVSPDRTVTDREGGKDAPVAATYSFDMDRLPEGALSIEVTNTGTQGAVCTLDGGALLVVCEDPALSQVIWQVAEGCDAVAIDDDNGIYEEDVVTKMILDEHLDLDCVGAARLYVVGTGPGAWTDGGGRVGLNDREWPGAFGRNGSMLLADLDATRSLLPRENTVTVRAQKNVGDGGVLVNRLAVLVTTRGTPVSADAGVAAGTVPTMTKAFLIDNPVVSQVAVTLPEQRSPFLVTVEDAETAGGGAPPEGEVYRYLKLRLEGAKAEPTFLALTFRVPSAWIADHGLKAEDIVLMRRVGGEWQAFPTVAGEEKDGSVEFTAQAERLSLFVIGGKAGNGAIVSETKTTPVASATTAPQKSPAGWFPLVAAFSLLMLLRRH